MSRVNDKEEVGRETIRQARNNAYPRVYAHEHHGDHHHQHRHKGHVHRTTNKAYDATCTTLNNLRRVLHIYEVSWHTAKHIACPLRILSLGLAVLLDILSHTCILRYITLRQGVTLELRSIEDARHPEE